jgi:hypothetical protein
LERRLAPRVAACVSGMVVVVLGLYFAVYQWRPEWLSPAV